jgi:hypothetical protein
LGGIAPLNDCCFKAGEVRLDDPSIPIKGGTWLGISQSSQTQSRGAVVDARLPNPYVASSAAAHSLFWETRPRERGARSTGVVGGCSVAVQISAKYTLN